MTRILKELKTPQELMNYLNQHNFTYGYVGKNNSKAYSGDDPDYGKDFAKEYHLQIPRELLNTKLGICWDYTELERAWLEQHNYEFKVFGMVVMPKNKVIHNNLITHTFVAYKQANKWYWFEYAFAKQRGIHEFTNLNDLIETVKIKQLEWAKDKDITDDINGIKVWEHHFPESCNTKNIMKMFIAKISQD